MSNRVGASVGRLLRDAARFDRTQSDPVVALRYAVGVAAPLAIGALAGNAALGLAATVGALLTGLADRPGPYLLRLLRMLGAAVGMGAMTALAVVLARSELLSLVLLFVLALGTGLSLSLGRGATQFAIFGTGAALVLGHTPQPAAAALHVGLLVAAGGAGQTLLAIAAWPLGRHRPERIVLAAVYRQLAELARHPHDDTVAPPAAAALDEARTTLSGLGHSHGATVEAYRIMVDEASRIRRELLSLALLAGRLDTEHGPGDGDAIRAALAAVGDALDATGRALDRGRAADLDAVGSAGTAAERRTDDAAARLRDLPDDPVRSIAAARLAAVSGQLREIVRTARVGATEGRHRDDGTTGQLLRHPISVLRANVNPDAAVLRHAIRLAVLFTTSDAVVRALDIDHGYWVTLTLLVVMRPDFAATLQRSVMRSVGTVLGLLLGTALVEWLPVTDWWYVVLIGIFAFLMRVVGAGNVAPLAIFLSALLVFLLELLGIGAGETLLDRSVSTIVGGAIAIVGAVVWPSWERQFLPGRLDALLRAYRDFLDAVVDPDATPTRLTKARSRARLARSNAQASIERASVEPVDAAAELELGRAVLAHSHRWLDATLSLDAVRTPVRDAGGLPLLRPWTVAVNETVDGLVTAIADGGVPEPDSLRPREDDLRTAVGGLPGPLAASLVEATDRITDSLDTLGDELRRQRPATEPVSRRPGCPAD